MLEYGQFLVLVCLTGWVVIVLAWGLVTVGDYAARLYLARLSDMVELKQKMRGADYE